jgi:SAM-dependent methyltransferase
VIAQSGRPQLSPPSRYGGRQHRAERHPAPEAGITSACAAPAGLALTGERTLPGIADENYWFRRHEAAYRALAPWLVGARVLEAGVGEGYGAALLRRSGSGPVFGLDYDAAVAAHVRSAYPSIPVARGDLQHLPFRDAAFDAVVHLQTIEHLHDQPGFVAQCARILRPAGTLIVSTPNRLTFSPGRDRPLNPFHTRELSADELRELLDPRFEVIRMYGLRHGARLRRIERRIGSLVDAQLAGSPQAWPTQVRETVHRVRANDFDLSDDAVDSSLDLVAICWRRP